MHLTLFGCYEFLEELERRDSRGYRTVILSIRARFVRASIMGGLSEMSVMDESDLRVNSEGIPISQLYFAEAIIILDEGEQQPSDVILQTAVVELGDLWDEFVRSFIDAGGFVGLRLICKDRQFRWSSEGRVVPEEKHTHTINP